MPLFTLDDYDMHGKKNLGWNLIFCRENITTQKGTGDMYVLVYKYMLDADDDDDL